MNVGDGLASGAKKASFTTRDARKMSKEEWDAMFAPEPTSTDCNELDSLGETRCSLPNGHEGPHFNAVIGDWHNLKETQGI